MSSQCQKIEIKKLPFYASDITNFTSAVCAVVTQMSSVNSGGEPLFTSWAATYSGDLYNTFTTVNTYSATWGGGGGNFNVNTFVHSNSANILQSNSVVNTTSGNWNSVYTSYNSSSASFLTNSSGNSRYVKLSGDVMTGGLSAPSLSTNNLYVAGSTINFFDGNGNVIQTLKSSDVGNFKSNYTLTNSRSANWENTYVSFSSQSANNLSVYNTVNTNSGSNWNYQGSDLKALTGNWQNTYTGFSSQSANNLSVYNTVNSKSANWDSTYSTVNTNSATNWNYQGTDIKSLSSNWQNTYIGFSSQSANNLSVYNSFNSNSSDYNSVYSTVNTNSGSNWNYQGTDIKSLTSNWQNTYTNFSTQSSNNLNVYSIVSSNSATNWNYQGNDIKALTGNWDRTYTNFSTQSANNLSLYTTVNTNSATNWNYQGNDIKALTGNWQNTYSTVSSYSAAWGTGGSPQTLSFNASNAQLTISDGNTVSLSALSGSSSGGSGIDTAVRELTSNWQNTYVSFSSQSANNLSVYNTVNTNSGSNWNYQGNDIKSLTANWQNTYSTVSSNSATNWNYQGNDIKALTANWQASYTALTSSSANWNDTRNTVQTNSATNWNYQGNDIKVLTGNWDQTYINFSSQSANNLSVYTTVQTNSAANWNYQGNDIKALTGNWQNTYSTVSSNSATNWNYQGNDIKALTGNWQNTYTNFSAQSANNLSVYTTVQTNSATNWNYQGNDIKSLTGNWQASYTALTSSSANWNDTRNTVQTNSATNWNYQGTDIKALTSNWQNTYTNFSTQSSNNLNVYTTVNTNSATNWNYQGNDIKALTGNWDQTYTNFSTQSANNLSVYTTVNTNSATNWNYQGTDIKSLTSNWQNTYSTVSSYSATWGTGGSPQTLSFNESNAQLSISGGNTVSLSALSSINYLYALKDVYIPSPANGQVLTYSSVLQKWTTGSPASASGQTGYYGSFYDTTAQTLTGVNQAKRLSIANTFEANGISLSSNKIVFNNIGTYELIFSIQYKNTSATQEDIYIWFRKNGVDIPDSSSVFTIPARKSAGIPAQLIAVTPFIATLAANDFIEIYWHCSATEVTVETFTTHSNPTIPDTPGVIVTVKQVTNVQLVPTVGAYLPLSGGTVTGVLSTTNVIYANGGNSDQWNSSYTTVNTNSATNWNYQGTDIKSLTGNWQNTYTNFSTQSANNLSVYTTVNSNSGVAWNYQGTDIKSLTGNWQNTYTNFSTQSADNLSVYSTVNASSATNWNYQGSDIKALTGNWQNTYSTVNSNSASWQDTYTNFSTQSAKNISVYTTVNSNSASWAPGTVTSVGLSSVYSTLTIGSTPITGSGIFTADLNLAKANTWTGQQTFNSASTVHGVGVITPKIYPATDSISAVRILKADGTTNIVTVDTTNQQVGVGGIQEYYKFSTQNIKNVTGIYDYDTGFYYGNSTDQSVRGAYILAQQTNPELWEAYVTGLRVEAINDSSKFGGTIAGIHGSAYFNQNGTAYGVQGTSVGPTSSAGTQIGVYGLGATDGVRGRSEREFGSGVRGEATAANSYALIATQSSLSGYALYTYGGKNYISGKLGLNTTSPITRLHLIDTSNLFRAGYDTSNYLNIDVGSTGIATYDAVGSGAFHRFSENIQVPLSGYYNFGTTDGSAGYGFRDNAGVVEVKSSGGSWASIAGAAISDAAYDSSWNGVSAIAPSKNAVYDQLQLMQTGGSEFLASDFTTSSTTAVSTNLSFAIAANEAYVVTITGTASKATSNTGLKLAIGAPTGCTISGEQYGSLATLAAFQTPSLITAINTLGTTFATGIGIQVTFRLEFRVTNGSTAGNITLQCATVTSNVATIYAGTRMTYTKATSV